MSEHLPLDAVAFPDNRHWRKQVVRLPDSMKIQLQRAVDELCTRSVLVPGRRHEKLERDGVYSVRLNDKYRLAYELLPNGVGKLLAVGPHDEVYRTVNRQS